MVKSATQPQVVRAKMKSNPVCDIHPRAVMKLEQVQSPDLSTKSRATSTDAQPYRATVPFTAMQGTLMSFQENF